MSGFVLNSPLSPEEFQRQLTDFVRQQFHSGRPTPSPDPQQTSNPPTEPLEPGKRDPFEFKHKPREVKAYLDRFVIKQDEAKKVLSVALCDHYHHVRLALTGQELP